MPYKIFYAFILILSVSTGLSAQQDSLTADNTHNSSPDIEKLRQPKNFIKTNPMGIVLKNYSIQYERAISRKISAALTFRTMPSTTLPFKDQIVKSVGDNDPDTKETIEKFKLSNFAITPEIRLYLSKRGYGRGFYIASFYRLAVFKTDDLNFTYSNSANISSTIKLSGKLTSNTGGLLFGVQWPLGKHLCLDWQILGPHLGSGMGEFKGVSSQPLTQEEQDDLKQELNDLDIPFTNKTVSVNANGASLKLNGPWGGIRTGLSVGFRFN